jgi:DNA repair protein RadA/Sms
LASRLNDRPLARSLIACGELLTGELRPVAYGEERLREAQKQGFTQALIARDNAPCKPLAGVEVLVAGRIGEALAAAFCVQADLAAVNPPVRTRERS